MKKFIVKTLIVVQALALLPLMPSQGAPQMQQQHSNIVSGGINSERTNKLTGEIRWHTSLGSAEQDARMAGKLIFWINMLGTLSGAT